MSLTNQGDEIAEDINLESIMEQISGCEDIDSNNIAEWVHGDDSEEVLTDDEIGHLVYSEEEDAKNEKKKSENEKIPQVSHEEGLNALELALKYVEEQPESIASDLLLLKWWRDIAAKKRMSKLKQCSITNFLTLR